MLMKKPALPIPRPSLRHLCPLPLAFSAVLAAFITFADAAVGGIFFVAPSTATYGWGRLDRHCPMGGSSGRDVMRKSAGPSLCMTLRGGGKHKEKRHVSGEPQETVNAIYAEHFPVADGHERKEKDTEKHFKDILQEKLRSKDKDEVLVNDEEEDDERFSYMKVSEAEMRRAEEREAQREREFQEHQEKKRMGLVVDENTEVIDTLRWPSAQDNFAREGARKGQQQRDRRETEEEVVLAGGEGHSLAHENEQELTVNEWLEKNGLAQYASTFETEGWDNLDAIHTMTEQDMLEIGVKRSFCLSLFEYITHLHHFWAGFSRTLSLWGGMSWHTCMGHVQRLLLLSLSYGARAETVASLSL